MAASDDADEVVLFEQIGNEGVDGRSECLGLVGIRLNPDEFVEVFRDSHICPGNLADFAPGPKCVDLVGEVI